MSKIEYEVVSDIPEGLTHEQIKRRLNDWGEYGWRLALIDPRTGWYYMMRERKQ